MLNSPIRMNRSFGFEISLMRLFRSRKPTDPKPFGIQHYGCCPFAFTRGYAKQPGNIVVLWDSKILPVLKSIYSAKVRPSVIKFVAVDVVNFCFRPLISSIEICKSVGKILMPINAYLCIPTFSHSFPSLFAYANVRTNGTFLSPSENASSSVVVKQFTQASYSKLWLSHDSVLSMIGQRPAGVDALGGLRHFIYALSFVQRQLPNVMERARSAIYQWASPQLTGLWPQWGNFSHSQ